MSNALDTIWENAAKIVRRAWRIIRRGFGEQSLILSILFTAIISISGKVAYDKAEEALQRDASTTTGIEFFVIFGIAIIFYTLLYFLKRVEELTLRTGFLCSTLL